MSIIVITLSLVELPGKKNCWNVNTFSPVCTEAHFLSLNVWHHHLFNGKFHKKRNSFLVAQSYKKHGSVRSSQAVAFTVKFIF